MTGALQKRTTSPCCIRSAACRHSMLGGTNKCVVQLLGMDCIGLGPHARAAHAQNVRTAPHTLSLATHGIKQSPLLGTHGEQGTRE